MSVSASYVVSTTTQVPHDHVGPQPLGERYRLGTGCRLADHLDVRLGGQHAAQALADDRVVVGQQHADGGHAGTVALTWVPAPGALRTASLPPASATRVRIPRRP